MSGKLETQLLVLPQGQIKGAKRLTIYEHEYYSFEGIPYAKPPLGELRFKAPQPADPWKEVKDCTKCGSKPMQKNSMSRAIEGSEDCLYLNVYAKTLKSDKPLPVMVYIYGGGFFMGEATTDWYSPDYFMREDIVLVTFNYRVCSLGFLSLNDPELQIPGNTGLRDQVLALRWVKEHIAHFNGDNKNITVFGQSAGGASTHLMMLTEQTRDLFQRAIPMSGCALNFWVNMPQTDMAYRLAKHHGYEGEKNDKLVLAFLRELDATKLVDHALLNDKERSNGYISPFGPIVEPYMTEDCVIPKPLFEMLKTTWSNKIPIMIGATSFEGLLKYTLLKMFPQIMDKLQHSTEFLLPDEIRDAHSEAENKQLSQRLIKAHFGDKALNEKAIMNFMDLYSHHIFVHGIHRTIMARLTYASAPTYLYRFDFDSPDFNHFRLKFCGKDPVRGVAHADDICYLFFHKDSWKVATDSAEYKTIQRMISIWTSFAKQSNPNCADIEPNVWKPLEKCDPYCALNISNDVKIMELPEKAKIEAWNSLYKAGDLY